MNYQELVNESGFLTPKGKEIVEQEVLQGVKKILAMMDTEMELRIMGSILSKHIGDVVADEIQK